MNYLKYYNLEDYLFSDVTNAFHERGYLTPEAFFAIVIWKTNRAKTAVKRKLAKHDRNLTVAVADLTRAIGQAATDREKLRIFLEDWQFGLPMATAILTVLYPDRFTVYDVRVRNEVGIIKDFAGRTDQIDRYFNEYLPKVAATTEAKNLRDKDRYLWGKSAYEGLQKFLAKS